MRLFLYSMAVVAAFSFVSGAYTWEAVNRSGINYAAKYSDKDRAALRRLIGKELKRERLRKAGLRDIY